MANYINFGMRSVHVNFVCKIIWDFLRRLKHIWLSHISTVIINNNYTTCPGPIFTVGPFNKLVLIFSASDRLQIALDQFYGETTPRSNIEPANPSLQIRRSPQ
jgi:hypothetical protein